MSTLQPTTQPVDYGGWFITVYESNPFSVKDLIGIDEDASLEAYEEEIIKALEDSFPGAMLTYNFSRRVPHKTRIYVTGPVGDYKDEGTVHFGVEQVIERVWDDGEFWVDAEEEEREEINHDG